MPNPKPRRRQLTEFQLDFVDDVVEFQIATRDEAVEAFKSRDDAKIESWKIMVYDGRDGRHQARRAEKEANFDLWRPTGKILPCASCG